MLYIIFTSFRQNIRLAILCVYYARLLTMADTETWKCFQNVAGCKLTCGSLIRQSQLFCLLIFLGSLYCKQYGTRSDCIQEQSDQGSYCFLLFGKNLV